MFWSRFPMISASAMIVGMTFGTGAGFAGDRTAPVRQKAAAPGATMKMQVDGGIESRYRKATWAGHQLALSGGNQTSAAADLPPTDCPPAPTQVCRDSWKPKLINPFPGKDTKTINPFE